MTVLFLPMPPSANVYWRSVTIRGAARVLESREARAYKADVAERLAALGVKPLAGPVVLHLAVMFATASGDLDNRVKPLLDALKGKALEDDRWVVEIHAKKRLAGEGQPESVQVELAPACPVDHREVYARHTTSQKRAIREAAKGPKEKRARPAPKKPAKGRELRELVRAMATPNVVLPKRGGGR